MREANPETMMTSDRSHKIEKRDDSVRLKLVIRGAVQGVGFRPYVFRLATEMNLLGWVSNTVEGVFIEVEGRKQVLDQFLTRLPVEKPAISFIQSLESQFLDPVGFSSFEIRESTSAGNKTTIVLPDIAVCPDCLKEVFDPNNRRHMYPFTNCTNCGPRYTIIQSLPYDRPNTTMSDFTMCRDCQREYENPRDRRFHAQPNACPVCGPKLELWDVQGRKVAENLYAMLECADAIRKGKIVAIKGLGGFHLIVDASSDDAVLRLRDRKRREEKPFALMYPSLEHIKRDCFVSGLEERLLMSPESPIVLLRGRESESAHEPPITLARVSPFVAPANPYLGIMLPYTPLHHVLMRELRSPVVATSGNLSDEPICTDEHEALDRLRGIADLFLVHNRRIVRHVDDSIARILLGRELILRRARGYAPLPIQVSQSIDPSVVALGAHLKNTVAISNRTNIMVSQHIGDLETEESYQAFQRAILDLQLLYDVKSPEVVCDMHPDYLSSKYAKKLAKHVTCVQHHYAHVAACMADNQLEGPVLGVSWDGTGYGLDGTVWGGEFLATNESSFDRVATFRQFRLPGGEKSIKEPRRTALGLLYEIMGDIMFSLDEIIPLKSFSVPELEIIHQMLEKDLNAPRTSSVGRLFDAVASIIGLRQVVRFEGQAAMELEFLTANTDVNDSYPFELIDASAPEQLMLVDWKQMILSVIDDVRKKVDRSRIAARFHNTLAEAIVDVAKRINREKVVLTGGCFQNAYLTERSVRRLEQEGFHPYWHQRIPPNDGGISLGQIVAYSRRTSRQTLPSRTTTSAGSPP